MKIYGNSLFNYSYEERGQPCPRLSAKPFCRRFYFKRLSKNTHKRYIKNPHAKNNAINTHSGTGLS